MGCRPPVRRDCDPDRRPTDQSPNRESNPRPFPYHGNALPTELLGHGRHENASRKRLQVDLLCDGETTRSAARIRNRRAPSAASPAGPSPIVARAIVPGLVVGVERLLRRRLLPLPPIAYAACLVELARHLLEARSRSSEATLEVGDALRDLLLAGGEHRDLTVGGAQLGRGRSRAPTGAAPARRSAGCGAAPRGRRDRRRRRAARTATGAARCRRRPRPPTSPRATTSATSTEPNPE